MPQFCKPAALAAALLLAAPVTSHAQGVQQLLQGLTTGNQSQDRALQEAYERGYQKGRQDEAQLHRGRGNDDRRGGYNAPRSGYDDRNYDNRGPDYRR